MVSSTGRDLFGVLDATLRDYLTEEIDAPRAIDLVKASVE
jgi:hypothetical protein